MPPVMVRIVVRAPDEVELEQQSPQCLGMVEMSEFLDSTNNHIDSEDREPTSITECKESGPLEGMEKGN